MFKPNKQFDDFIKNASIDQLKHLDVLSGHSAVESNAVYYLENDDVASQMQHVEDNFALLDAD